MHIAIDDRFSSEFLLPLPLPCPSFLQVGELAGIAVGAAVTLNILVAG